MSRLHSCHILFLGAPVVVKCISCLRLPSNGASGNMITYEKCNVSLIHGTGFSPDHGSTRCVVCNGTLYCIRRFFLVLGVKFLLNTEP